MKKKRYVQLFTTRPENRSDNLEVDGELTQIVTDSQWVYLKTKDETGEVWEHYFPAHNVDMIRVSYND